MITLKISELESTYKELLPDLAEGKTFKDVVADSNFELYDAMGIAKNFIVDYKALEIKLDENHLDDLDELIDTSKMDEEAFMKVCEKLGIYHDGGDDIDYMQSNVSVVFDVVEAKLIEMELRKK